VDAVMCRNRSPAGFWYLHMDWQLKRRNRSQKVGQEVRCELRNVWTHILY